MLVGVIMVARPGVGLSILTLVLGAYLLIDGIFGVLLAFHIRPQAGWGLAAVRRDRQRPCWACSCWRSGR